MAHFKRKAELANPMIDVEPHSGDWTPATEADRKTIYVQLERMLESPLFRNSKRYPVLLRYLVEQSLEGNRDLLKERLLGVTVFHRPADYDTSEDTIVRLTAGEVRKRIAQYYHQPENCGSIFGRAATCRSSIAPPRSEEPSANKNWKLRISRQLS
jgi:hypothetical protein